MSDHTEAIEITYDPERLSYDDLLETFWSAHRPTSPPWSRQYRSALFVHDEAQRAAAHRSLAARQDDLGVQLYTTIETASTFTQAEAYHQKYRLKGTEVGEALSALYPDEHDWVASTAAARLNGWMAGYGDLSQARAELASIGLPERLGAAVLAKLR